MTLTIVFMLVLFIFSKHSAARSAQSLEMSQMNGWQFQCVNTTCTPFVTVTTLDVYKCQLACLAEIFCQAVSFHQSAFTCQLFTNTPNVAGNMLVNADSVTMIVMSGTRILPEYYTCSSFTVLLNWNCPYYDIASESPATYKSCCQWCLNTTNCNTFVVHSNTCWLKYSIGNGGTSLLGSISATLL